MIGKTISHYNIIEKLGEGGMGVVYKAEDTKLNREVAIKFLPRQIAASEEERQRFKLEAQAAAALNHNNIATIHEIDEVGDDEFIVMEFIKGESLKEKIATGPLKLDEAVRIATEVADGLHVAHEHKIVHRDIKPANIMLTAKGQCKITDFGLAKMAQATLVTKEGTTLGTAAYMSPEQARGEIVDHRTDIWSFGVVFYEMLTGQLPFKGDYEQAVTYSILNEEPEPITGLRTGVPIELERIVNKCLQKEPSDRYQGANELLVDLRQITKASERDQGLSGISILAKVQKRRKDFFAGAVLSILILTAAWYWFLRPGENQLAPERKMLVVLPFENLGPPEEAYFAAGMTEEITSRLAAVRELGVISRTSAAQYNRSGKTIKEIGDDFGVNYVLDGTVRWNRGAAGENKVRITPQLIGVSDDTQLWSERYDRVIDDIFVVQSEIAAQVVQKLGVTLLLDDQQIIEAKPTENLEAYDYYLRGKEYFARRGITKDTEIAVQMYERAVELDPNFAVAYAALSRARTHMYFNRSRFNHIKDPLLKAKEALTRAQQLAPELVETHMALGHYYWQCVGNYDKALEHFSLVKGRQPNNADVNFAIGAIRQRQGKWEEAAVQLEQAVKLDPRNPARLRNLGISYFYMRQYTKAERYMDHAISLAPDIPITYGWKAALYVAWHGKTQRARQVLEKTSLTIGSRLIIWGIAGSLWDLDILDRNYEQAIKRNVLGPDTLRYYLNKAETLFLMKQTQLTREYADSVRIFLKPKLKQDAQNEVWHRWLGVAYGMLDNREEAIREGKKAVQLSPVSKDAYYGPSVVMTLARIYAMVGEYDAAIGQLEFLLSIPSTVTVPLLKLAPIWDPLREHPRFKRLLVKYGGESQ